MPPRPTCTARPVRLKAGEVEEALIRLLPSEKIEQLTRETCFIQRERKHQPIAFLWVMILSFGVQLQRNLRALKDGYDRLAKLATISYPDF